MRQQEREHRSLIRAAALAAAQARAAKPQAEPPPVFLTLRRGLGSLIDRLESVVGQAGIEVRTGAGVRAVERAVRGGYTLRLDGEELHADAVLVTAEAPAAARLLQSLVPEAARELAAIAYADVALVALAYRRDQVAHPLDGSGFVVPRGENIDITACTWVSSKWPQTAPADTVLIRTYHGRADADVLAQGDGDLLSTARAALARSLGIAAPPLSAQVIRTSQGLPQYAVGHLARLARIETAVSRLPGLFVTGAAFRGVGLPDCVHQGQAAADAALSATPAAAVPVPG